jgi:membrane protein required for colicin V production
MNMLDMIVVVVVAVSGLFAFVRGFVREALSILAWVGAGFVAIYGFPSVQPAMRHAIKTAWIADLTAVVLLFVLTLVLLSILVGVLSAGVRAAGLGPLDRTLGLFFGLARGVVLLCLGYLMLSHFLPQDNWPDWIAQASSRKFLAEGAERLKEVIPQQVIDRTATAAQKTEETLETAAKSGQPIQSLRDQLTAPAPGDPPRGTPQTPPGPASPPAGQRPAPRSAGYTADQSQDMNRIIQENGGHR